MAKQSIPLPPGAELVDQGGIKLPPGATLVSSGGLSPELRETPALAAKHFAQTADSGAGASLKRTGSSIVHLPGAVIDAFTTPPQNAEEKSAMGLSGQGQFGLGLYRLIGHPMAAEHIKAQQLHAKAALEEGEGQHDAATNFWTGTEHRANMHDIASFVPVVGPMAAGITERYDSGDKSGALTDLATVTAAPEVAKVAGKGIKAIPGAAGSALDATGNAITKAVENNPRLAQATINALEPRAAMLRFLKNKVNAGLENAKAAPEAEATAAGPIPGEPTPAPYRLSGDQIVDATTVTPRKVLGPDRQLPAAPPEAPAAAPAKPPITSQVLKDSGVTQAMKEAGVAAPSASSRAVRPNTGSLGITGQLAPRSDIQFPPGLSGQDASLMQLTRYSINELRAGALKRGIKVAAGDTHTQLIDKIQNSMTPAELESFNSAAQSSQVTPSKFQTNNDLADNLNKAAADIQAAKGSPYEIASLRNAANTIRNHPEDMAQVDLGQTKLRGIDKRITKRIEDFKQAQNAVPGDDGTPTVAYRVRDAGETGIQPRGHAQATTDLPQAQSYVEGRGSAQNAPQEVVKVDLTKLNPKDYVLKTGPGGKTWVQFKNAVPESYISKVEEQPQLANESNMEDLLRKSLDKIRAKKAGAR